MRLLMERAHHCAQQSSRGAAAADLSEALDAAKSAWRNVREKAGTKSAQLREVNRRAEVFHAELSMMSTWLGLSENKLASITEPSASRDAITRQLTDIQSLQNDIERKMRDYDALGKAARDLMDSGDVDQDTVSSKLTDVQNRWSQLVDGQIVDSCSLFVLQALHNITFSLCHVTMLLTYCFYNGNDQRMFHVGYCRYTSSQ